MIRKLGKGFETKRMLSVRKCYSMLVVHITCIVIASHGVHTYFPNSQSQAVVMEVLSVGGGVVGERGVREQIITTVPSFICYGQSCDTSRT